jgi:hypothetical protein
MKEKANSDMIQEDIFHQLKVTIQEAIVAECGKSESVVKLDDWEDLFWASRALGRYLTDQEWNAIGKSAGYF